MSTNQPWRGREPGRRGRGRHREGDEECARFVKKVRPATLGDAIRKSSSSSSPPSSEGQQARSQGQPIRAAMPSNQPGRGWGAASGGGGREDDGDDGMVDSEKGRQQTLPQHLWPALPSSSSTESAPTQVQTMPGTLSVGSILLRIPNTQLGGNTGKEDLDQGGEKGRLPEGKHKPVTPSSGSTPCFPNIQPEGSASAAGLDQERCLREGKRIQYWRPCSPKNTTSPSSSAESMPRSPNNQPRGSASAADLDQGGACLRGSVYKTGVDAGKKNTPSPSSSADSTPRSSNSQPGGIAGAAYLDQGVRLREGKPVEDCRQCSKKNTPSPSSSADSTPRTTGQRNQVIMRQLTPSSGSDGTPPSNHSKKSENSSGKKLSYIGVVEKASDPDKLKRLATKLTVFLNNFKEDGGAFPYYRAELEAIKLRSPFRLTIQFIHLIKYDVDLAFETWKYQANMQDWILPAICNFLKLYKYGSEDEIMSKTQLTLSGFPYSMKKVVDVLQAATYSLELLGEHACEAKADAKLVVQLFFTAAFARHLKDLSWDGQFGAIDMWLLNNAELQICRPCVAATPSRRLRDLQKGGEELLPYFKGPAGYPAYFAELEEDLLETNVNQIIEPWCAEYFSFHMACLPSIVRRNLELAIHYISKNIPIELEGIFGMLSSEQQVRDWQDWIKNSQCEPLKKVLNYIDPLTGQKVKYENNIGGLVKYKRHFLEHVLFGKIIDINEVELFGARKFSKHLPETVKLLLERKKMVACFGAAWSSVKSSRFDARDTPVKQ